MLNDDLKEAVLSCVADLFLGLAGAWVFTGYDSLTKASFSDLLYSLSLAILSFGTAVYLRYVKCTRFD